jgi:hypothetical protein
VDGPYPNDGDAGLDKPFLDETRPPGKWRKIESGDMLDFLPLFDRRHEGVAYAHVFVHAPERRAARLWFGSDDGVKMWVNGSPVFARHEHRACAPDQDRVDVVLSKGWNRVLFKVDQGGGAWGVTLRLEEGLTSQAEPPESFAMSLEVADASPRKWSDVADDPWGLLPQVTDAQFRKWTGSALSRGPGFVALGPGSGTEFDAALHFATEGVAWLRAGADWLLVRADLMPLFARHPVVGRIGPAILLRTELSRKPACELELVGDLRCEPPAVFPGEAYTIRLGKEEFPRRAAEDARAGWQRITMRGEVGAIRILDPFTVTVTQGQASWSDPKLRLEVKNHRPARAKFRADFPDSAEFELASGEMRVLEGPLPMDLDVSVSSAGRTWSLRRKLVKLPWRLSGPYDNTERRGFETVHPPEKGEVEWRDIVPAEAGGLERVDLSRAFERNLWVCAYAALDFEVDADVAAKLRFGSDDTLTVWLDGEKIVAENVYRACAPDQAVREVALRKGRHRLLVKVCQGEGAWEFRFSITGTDDKPIAGFKAR